MIDDTSGEEFPTGGEYREVAPNEKLVFTWGEPDASPGDSPLITVTFTDLGGLTRLTFDLRGEDGMSGDESYGIPSPERDRRGFECNPAVAVFDQERTGSR